MCIIILQGKRPQASLEAGIDINVNPIGIATDRDYMKQIRDQTSTSLVDPFAISMAKQYHHLSDGMRVGQLHCRY